MNAPAARTCCISRGPHLARVCEGTRPHGSRRSVLVMRTQSRPRPSITRGPASAPCTVLRRGPLSAGVPTSPGLSALGRCQPCGVLSLASVSGDGCRSGGGGMAGECFGGSGGGGQAGMSLSAGRGVAQLRDGVLMRGEVTSVPLSKLVGPSGTRFSQGEAPPPQRRRDPLDLPTPSELSVVLCRLRDELPSFFDGHHSFGMYSEDMVFQGNLIPLQLQLKSVRGYRVFVHLSRWLCLALLSRPRLELLKITKDVDEGCVRARWRLVGGVRALPFGEERTLVDAVSTFDVNTCGLISRHMIDQVMPSKETQMAASWLPQSLLIGGLSMEFEAKTTASEYIVLLATSF